MPTAPVIIHIPQKPRQALTEGELKRVADCLEIRRVVFIVGQGVPREIERDEREFHCGHLLLLENSSPVGTLRYRRTEEGVKLERIAVLPDCQDRGYGRRLVEAAVRIIRSQDETTTIYLHAQLTSEGFYRRLGFVGDGGPAFREAGIEHRTMVLPSSPDQERMCLGL